MAISRKPQAAAKSRDVVDINALIHKGGSAASEQVREGEKPTPLLLRLPSDLLSRIDLSVKSRRIKTPRHTWILEAIVEKLEREAELS
jgi:hypothetical protein